MGRLLAYLFGPGKREEHRNPHLVAAWQGAGPLARLQPPCEPTGRHDLRRLTDLLEQPVRATTKAVPPLTVWHCSVRNHPTDRTLSDQQWQHIAAEIMAGVGLAPHADPNAVRWVAVRHADDHIHIVATLVCQDGRIAWAWHDQPKAQAAARDLELRYNLYRVGPVDNTSHHRPTAAEQNKAARQGRDVPRDRLRRDVRAAAAGAANEADFLTALRTAGVLVRLRHSTLNPDEVTGYAVGLPDHHTATGDTIWYSGGRLAPELTLPRLRQRWHPADAGQRPDPTQRSTRTSRRADTFTHAATAARAAAEHLAHGATDDEAADIASAAGDLLTATARAFEGRDHGRISDAAESYDRANREPFRRPIPHTTPRGRQLRTIARLIFAMGRLTRDEDTALQLVLQMSILADTLADLRDAQQRLHQARAARHAAEQLRIASAATNVLPQGRRASHGPIASSRPRGPGTSRSG